MGFRGRDVEAHDRQRGSVDGGAQVTEQDSSPGQGRERRGGALDPRLLRYARTTRRFVVLAVGIGGATALLVVAQAFLIATVVAGAFVDHRSAVSLRTPLVALLAVVAGRAALAWAAERAAHRASASAKSELRRAAATRVAALGPHGLEAGDTGRLSVLLTTGIDALDGYFSRYLPQLFLAVIVPVTIIGVVAGADWVSAALIAVSLPLIPLFMALVGASTKDRTAARLLSLQRLAGHFLDVVAGLPTLKVFGRAKAQARSIAAVTDRYRSATMATLRLTFLSSLILELLATVSVALVAVAVGLRLLGGHMTFEDALFVLVLAPEAYLPLPRPRRQLPRQRGRDEGSRRDLRAPRRTRRRAGRRFHTGGRHRNTDRRPRRHLPRAASPGSQRCGPRRGTRRDGGADGDQWLRQVDPALRRPRAASTRRRERHARRDRPGRCRPRRLAPPYRLGPPAAASLRALGRRECPARPGRRLRRRGGGRARRRRSDRGGAAPPPRPRHAPRRGGRRLVRRGTPAPGSGAGIRARRATPRARRADRRAGQRDGGGRARGGPPSRQRSHRPHRGPPSRAGRAGGPGGRAPRCPGDRRERSPRRDRQNPGHRPVRRGVGSPRPPCWELGPSAPRSRSWAPRPG